MRGHNASPCMSPGPIRAIEATWPIGYRQVAAPAIGQTLPVFEFTPRLVHPWNDAKSGQTLIGPDGQRTI